jgi:RND family efflux transporter MFP subunit
MKKLGAILRYARAHKIISIIVILALAGGGYYWYSTSTTTTTVTKYVVEDATTDTITTSVSGTGQVDAGTTINVSPKVSEEVTSIKVAVGDKVTAGQVLIQLDSTTERRALQQAKLSLEQAQLSAQETNEVATTTLLQQQSAVTTAEQSLANASTSLVQDYQTGFNDLGSIFINLQTVTTGLQDFMKGKDISSNQSNPDAYVALMPMYLQSNVIPYETALTTQYNTALAKYQQAVIDYHAASVNSSQATLDSLFAETYSTAQSVNAAVKAGKDFFNYIANNYPAGSNGTQSLPTITTTFQNDFSGYTSTMNSTVSSVQSTITGISDDRTSITNDQSSLIQASTTLAETLAGPTATTLLSQQISIQTAQANLTTAQENLDYTSVTAPISGTVSAISATVGETAGSSAVTIVSEGDVAAVTLTESDVADVAVGDPATLTFDAIDGLSLAGKVVEVDPVGTVSQGVASYGVQVSFSQPADTSSSLLVKPGMSVTADIVTKVAQNVIAVPNAAVLTSGSSTYILAPSTDLSATELSNSASGGIELSSTKRITVTTGLSNDTMTEIASGVTEGEQIIVQTIKSSSASKTTTTATTKTTTNESSVTRLLSGSTGGGAGGGGGTPPSGGTP